jgi:parvulin-like peptidyl-prolyl isomerase
MVSAFENACRRLSPGSTSDIVSTSFGYHIIRLTGRKD